MAENRHRDLGPLHGLNLSLMVRDDFYFLENMLQRYKGRGVQYE